MNANHSPHFISSRTFRKVCLFYSSQFLSCSALFEISLFIENSITIFCMRASPSHSRSSRTWMCVDLTIHRVSEEKRYWNWERMYPKLERILARVKVRLDWRKSEKNLQQEYRSLLHRFPLEAAVFLLSAWRDKGNGPKGKWKGSESASMWMCS